MEHREEQLLRTFQKRVADMEKTALAHASKPKLTLHLAGRKEGEELDAFDPDQFKVFCLTFRQFRLQGDDVNLGRICNLIQKHCDCTKLRGWAAHYREAWNGIWNAPLGIGVSSNGGATKNYTTHEFFDLWANGGQFHSNPEKEAQLDSMPHLAPDALLMVFQSRVPGMFSILRLVAEVIQCWLDEPGKGVPDPPALKRPGTG